MAGRKIILPSAFTDTTLPVLGWALDPVMPDAGGALLLIDPSHPGGPWPAGTPIDQAVLPNVAGVQAAAAMGVTESATNPIVYRPPGFAGSVGLLERSTKGGLHGICAQTPGNSPVGSGPSISVPPALLAYILAHPTNDFYFSLWSHTTRAAKATGVTQGAFAGINGSGRQTLDLEMIMNYGKPIAPDVRPNTSPPRLGATTPADYLAGPKFGAVATSYWYSPPGNPLPGPGLDGIPGLYLGGGMFWGSAVATLGVGSDGSTGEAFFSAVSAASSSTATREGQPSWLFYRFYAEELTISGRTFAQVNALDQAEYTKQVLTPGGRYYGDVFTDPATIP